MDRLRNSSPPDYQLCHGIRQVRASWRVPQRKDITNPIEFCGARGCNPGKSGRPFIGALLRSCPPPVTDAHVVSLWASTVNDICGEYRQRFFLLILPLFACRYVDMMPCSSMTNPAFLKTPWTQRTTATQTRDKRLYSPARRHAAHINTTSEPRWEHQVT